jgi:hypothetical protein
MQGEDFYQAVELLLSWSNLDYVESVEQTLRTDPHHLVYHKLSVAYEVRKRLWAEGRGIYIEDDSIALLILNEALLRIPKASAA